MGSWSIILALCSLVCLGLAVGGRLDDRTVGWLLLTALFFLVLALIVRLTSLLLTTARRARSPVERR